MPYAPIVIFAFNRLKPLELLIDSILNNTEAIHSDLYVFVDGYRERKVGEKEKVYAVRKFVESISGFKSLHYRFNDINIGLGPSVISGVSEVINKYGRAIILEDDLVLSNNCLCFLNTALDKYVNENKVFSICGYTNKVKLPSEYNCNSYFCVRSSSWGWATWADRWNSVDWNLENWIAVENMKKSFNRWGGSDCFQMLKDWKEGRNSSWAIRFCFAQFLQNKLSLFPTVSKVKNNGFEGDGMNCKTYSRFKYIFDKSEDKNFIFPNQINMYSKIYKSSKSYHSILKRIWSRIMYMIQ